MIWRKQRAVGPASSASLLSAHRDALVVCVLIGAVCLLIWNGTSFFQEVSFADAHLGNGLQVASTALILNATKDQRHSQV